MDFGRGVGPIGSGITPKDATYGGIDFNPNNLPLQTRGQGVDFNLPSDLKDLERIPINGLTPVIFQITPVNNISLLLGLGPQEKPQLNLAQ